MDLSVHPCDEKLVIDGQCFVLRLTMTALAEISREFKAQGPTDLAGLFRKLTKEHTRQLAYSLTGGVLRHETRIENAQLVKIVMSIASVFERALAPLQVELSCPASLAKGTEKATVQENRHEDGGWPFESWLRLAVKHFSLSPQEFWNMALYDWFVLMQSDRTVPINQNDLRALKARFPDIKEF